MRELVLIALVVFAWLGQAPAAFAEKRLALVIGVKGYKSLPALVNTIADAELIAEKLRAADFDVGIVRDPNNADLQEAARSFARKIEDAGRDTVALVYYAGHGVQNKKQVNYIIGADADLKADTDLPTQGFKIDQLLETLEDAQPKLLFAIFDACRDDPLPESASRGVRRGLAPQVDLPPNVLIAYSTGPRETADDGPPRGHSPFASALAEELDAPGPETVQLFQLVKRKVLDLTGVRRQIPWVDTQRVTVEFYFHPRPSSSAQDSVPKPAPSPPATPTAMSMLDSGEIDYGKAVDANDPTAYEVWLRQYPDHPRHATVFKLLQRLREESLWRRAEAAVSDADKISALGFLLEAIPDGVYADKARERKRALEAMIPPSPPPAPALTLSAVRRLKNVDAPGNDLGDRIANSDLDQCEAACQSRPNCVGYTFDFGGPDCFLKSRVSETVATTQNAVTGVLVDRAPNLNGAVSLRPYEGKDAPGNDRGVWLHNILSEDECQRACTEDKGCVGYTYSIQHLVCIRKSYIGTPVDTIEPAVTGEFVERSNAPDLRPRPVARIRVYEGMDSWGQDRGSPMHVSIEVGATSCGNDSGCAAYVYNRRHSVCILKDAIGPLSPASMLAVTVIVDGK